MLVWLRGQGYGVNRKRVSRLMERMGIEALYPKPRLSQPGEEHKIHPYLLKTSRSRASIRCGVRITYIRMPEGLAYLVAVMD